MRALEDIPNLLSRAEAIQMLVDSGANKELAESIIVADRNLALFLEGQIAVLHSLCIVLLSQALGGDDRSLRKVTDTLAELIQESAPNPTTAGFQHRLSKLSADLLRQNTSIAGE